MPPENDFDIETLISAAGSIDGLRDLMGLDERRGYNLISQWRTRAAIPAAARHEHRKLFLRLTRLFGFDGSV